MFDMVVHGDTSKSLYFSSNPFSQQLCFHLSRFAQYTVHYTPIHSLQPMLKDLRCKSGGRGFSRSLYFNSNLFQQLCFHLSSFAHKKLYITLKYIAYSLRLNTYAVSPEVESNVLKLSGENLYYNRCTINQTSLDQAVTKNDKGVMQKTPDQGVQCSNPVRNEIL